MENWKLTGTEDVTIEKIELIDSKTVKLTLSGNSKELYTDSKIGVEFYHKLITFEITDENGQPVKIEDRKIQLDADGVEAAWYKSTNTINFNKQSKTENDGGRVVSTFTVKFDTNGGNNIASKTVKRNRKIEAIEEPVKAGFKFDGWYMDEALTEKFDPDAKITSSMTLYAKWSENLVYDSENEIVLTIGEKDALIFGEMRTNDVAPYGYLGKTLHASKRGISPAGCNPFCLCTPCGMCLRKRGRKDLYRLLYRGLQRRHESVR